MFGNEQVGGVSGGPAGSGAAALWHGTAASFVLLAPGGSAVSGAVATDGVHQYGFAEYSGANRAVMWSGSAVSVQSLDPGAPYIASQIHAGTAVRQAGEVSIYDPFLTIHAAMWTGSAQSFIDLNPPWAHDSVARGACDTALVGYANAGGSDIRSGIWMAPDFQFQELPLPPGIAYAYPTSVEFFNGQYWIGGYGYPADGSGYSRAILWTGIPAPGSLAPFVFALAACARRRRP